MHVDLSVNVWLRTVDIIINSVAWELPNSQTERVMIDSEPN